MRRVAAILAATCLAGMAPALAHHDAVSAAHPGEGVAFDPHVGASLPGGLRFVDDSGRRVTLGSELAGPPVVLVLGYPECKDLCPLTVAGVAQALDAGGLDSGTGYRALFASIDPRATPEALAAAKRARLTDRDRDAWTFLAGDARSVDALAASVGFHYRYDAAHDDYAHPAGFVVVTPEGRIARYFPGVRFDPGELKAALREAAAGRAAPGPPTPLLLLCYHFDPLTGRYTLTVIGVLRILGAIFLLAAAAWMVRERLARRRT